MGSSSGNTVTRFRALISINSSEKTLTKAAVFFQLTNEKQWPATAQQLLPFSCYVKKRFMMLELQLR